MLRGNVCCTSEDAECKLVAAEVDNCMLFGSTVSNSQVSIQQTNDCMHASLYTFDRVIARTLQPI
jgi:hypothetical protein